MRFLRNRWLRILLLIPVVLVLLVLAVVIFLPREKIRDLALDQARSRLGREVTAGEVGISFGGGLGVTLADLVVHNPPGFAGEPLAAVDAIDLKLAIGPLFRRQVRIDRLIIQSPRLNLVNREDGSNNYTFAQSAVAETPSPAATEDRQSGPAATISMDQFAIRDGRLQFTAGGQTTGLAGLNGSLVLAGPAPGRFHLRGELAAENTTFSQLSAAPELPLHLDYDLLWDDAARRLDITNLDGEVAQFAVQASGDVQVAEAGPTTNLEVAIPELDLGDLWQLLRPLLPPEQKGELAGRATARVRLAVGPAGGLDALTYSGTADLRDVAFTATDLVDELLDLDASLEFDQDRYTIKSSTARFNAGTFDLAGTLRDPLPYFLPPELQGEGAVPRPHLDFQLSTQQLDVDRLMPAASPTGRQANGPGSPTGQDRSAPLEMEFPDLTASGTFTADRLLYMEIPFTDISGQVSIQDRVLTVSQVEGRVFEGAINALAAIDLNDLNDPRYSGDYQATDIQVDGFMQRFTGASGLLLGKTSMDGSFATHGLDPAVIRNSLTLNSDASLRQGRLVTRDQIRGSLGKLAEQTGHTIGGEQVISDLFTHISVADGKVGLQDLKTGLGDWGDLRFGGHYAFTGELDYRGNLQLTEEQTNRLFASGVMRELANLLGDQRPRRLTIPLTVGGTQTAPRIDLGLGAVLEDLQKKALDNQKTELEDKAKDEIKKGLEGLFKKLK